MTAGIIHDITPPDGLKPKAKYVAEVNDTCINVDGCIEVMRTIDTPQAKAVYHAFRKRLAEFRTSMQGAKPEKMREEAFFKALTDLGFNPTFTPINGTME